MHGPAAELIRRGFVNLTPFSAGHFLLLDARGTEVLTLAVKASFLLTPPARLTPLEPQLPIHLEPVFHGKTGASSLKYELDAVLPKRTTDVVLLGNAHAPAPRTTQVEVSIRVGALSKEVLVLGDRVWDQFMGTTTLSSPLPFERMPLTYERAYGGWDRSDPEKPVADMRNPVGTGFIAHPSRTRCAGIRLPNLEDPRNRIHRPGDRPAPAGLGFIAPHWLPRLQLAGTHDTAWQQQRFPLAPQDFNPHHHNAAPSDLQSPAFLVGGEPVELLHVSARGPLSFRLPSHRFEGVVMMRSQRQAFPLHLDTVLIDTDADHLVMTWRGALPIHRRVHELAWAKVQSVDGGPRT
ncbi:DUF2169 family type VI secretion system accessory protein [Corallococcus llansteffanensis]|uniref:DUF2169 domain-containing protein n=1 Tax=Corallococcus llansteffanensis TaxID=2316731 RepID=A0A3A8PU64_9BACT|nr:DUF2169 domain-containing protein [Corallococcus llansteffanensis]RKH59943.1 DUF2169 domain-containing protein [Corallococcus llansteffanensis]